MSTANWKLFRWPCAPICSEPALKPPLPPEVCPCSAGWSRDPRCTGDAMHRRSRGAAQHPASRARAPRLGRFAPATARTARLAARNLGMARNVLTPSTMQPSVSDPLRSSAGAGTPPAASRTTAACPIATLRSACRRWTTALRFASAALRRRRLRPPAPQRSISRRFAKCGPASN